MIRRRCDLPGGRVDLAQGLVIGVGDILIEEITLLTEGGTHMNDQGNIMSPGETRGIRRDLILEIAIGITGGIMTLQRRMIGEKKQQEK